MAWLQIGTSVSKAWTVDIDAAGAGVETYTSNPAQTNVEDQLADLVTWCNALVRGWWPLVTFAYRVDATAIGAASPVLYALAAQPFDFTPDAAATALMGWTAHVGTDETLAGRIAGGWYPAKSVYMRGWLRDLGKGDAGGVGALCPGVPGSAGLRGQISALASHAEVGSLQTALRAAPLPRRALVWHDLSGAWVDVALGGLSQERLEQQVYRVTISALGA